MATYAEFYRLGSDGAPVPACGDRSVIRLDGRVNQQILEQLAEVECRKRDYVAWQLIKGPTLLRAKPITRIVSLYY